MCTTLNLTIVSEPSSNSTNLPTPTNESESIHRKNRTLFQLQNNNKETDGWIQNLESTVHACKYTTHTINTTQHNTKQDTTRQHTRF
mmetsp:Transcript_15760/g.34114  ORF Transcript_15760/g.34114 Transcript_15760/m.34114 type:complete len:87 (+) Transcript_15760:288-548(+)